MLAFLPLPTSVLVIALFFSLRGGLHYERRRTRVSPSAGRFETSGERFTGGLVLIVPDPLQISRRLVFAQGLILSRERGSARVGALILFHTPLINMTEKSKWL